MKRGGGGEGRKKKEEEEEMEKKKMEKKEGDRSIKFLDYITELHGCRMGVLSLLCRSSSSSPRPLPCPQWAFLGHCLGQQGHRDSPHPTPAP